MSSIELTEYARGGGKTERLFGNRWLLQYAHGVSVLSFSFSRFLNELNLGKLSETVIVHGNAPHDRPRFLVSHLIGNHASFLCTKAPMLRIPDELSGWHGHRLRRVHWSKEASRLGFVFPCWSTPGIKLICYWIIGTMVETIIRRWCGYVGGNNFVSPW